MTVESLRLRLLLVGPLRLFLGAVFVVAARAAGGTGTATLLAFAVGAFATAFLVSNDPRARFRGSSDAPESLPSDARIAPAWMHALHASLPSTVGVAVLAGLTLAVKPTLTALLAGILVGLGFAALLLAYGIDGRLYLDPRTRKVFRRAT